MIILASSSGADLEATIPVPAYVVCIDIKTIGGAMEHLKNDVKADHGADCIPSTALSASLSTGIFIWDQPDLPSHVRFFCCGDTGQFGSSSEESMQLHLKSEGAGLSSAEINKLVKQSSHSPCDFHTAHDHMGNYHSLCHNVAIKTIAIHVIEVVISITTIITYLHNYI
jgi:hypothetical protein